MSSIGVVIPTRNSVERLPLHLDHVEKWLDVVDQIVVVDSESTDGTAQLLRQRLKHPKIEFLQHPPGLYASWNFGLGKLETKWAYISTVGDTITREQLLHLSEAGDALGCDLICSPPKILRSDGSEDSRGRTPSQIISMELGLLKSVLFSNESTLAYAARFAFAHGMNTPIGSSASNLYRTEVLKKVPFPTQYGSAGDFFWLLENVTDLRFGLTPTQGSTFLLHPSEHAPVLPERKLELAQSAAIVSRSQIAKLRLMDAASPRLLELISSICETGESLALVQYQLEILKMGIFGKIKSITPKGWKIRSEKKQLQAQVRDRESRIIDFIDQIGCISKSL